MSTAPSSGRPKVASALPNAAIEASSDMSTGMIVCFPVPLRRAERASRRSIFRAAKTRVWPANARRSHSGAPMPPVAPVTRIVFCILIAPPLSAAMSSSEALAQVGTDCARSSRSGIERGVAADALCGAKIRCKNGLLPRTRDHRRRVLCPLNVDSSRPLCANSGHSSMARRSADCRRATRPDRRPNLKFRNWLVGWAAWLMG